MNVSIYALKDPFTSDVKYIGRTVNPESRLTGHVNNRDGSQRAKWISRLIAKNTLPVLEVLEVTEYTRGPERELFWLNHYTDKGLKLLNVMTPRKLVACKVRGNGGRMTVEDKKIPVTIYMPKSLVDAIGIVELKAEILNFANNTCSKIDKRIS